MDKTLRMQQVRTCFTVATNGKYTHIGSTYGLVSSCGSLLDIDVELLNISQAMLTWSRPIYTLVALCAYR